MTPIGPDAIVASTASLAAAAAAASPSASPSPLRNPTSPTIGTKPSNSPDPRRCTALENSPSCPRSSAVSPATTRSGSMGIHACMIVGRLTSARAGHDPGSTKTTPVMTGGASPLSTTDGVSALVRWVQMPASGSTAAAVPMSRMGWSSAPWPKYRTSPSFHSMRSATASMSTTSSGVTPSRLPSTGAGHSPDVSSTCSRSRGSKPGITR